MMQLTEEQRKALMADCNDEIIGLKDALKDCGDDGYAQMHLESKLYRQQIALAALTAKEEPCEDCGGSGIAEEPSDDGLGCGCCMCCGTGKSGLYKAPPGAELRLPDEKSTDVDYAYYPLTKARHEGWNACLAEIKRLNATAPAEGKE